MKLEFYHYVHCPFCVRVRMASGYLNLSYDSHVVPYNDETTPVNLTGKKMLPIMVIDGKAMNESLDIISEIDKKNLLRVSDIREDHKFTDFEKLLEKLGKNVHNLAMPYWIWTPEFDESSRSYFQKKKEEKRGPFKDLVKNSSTYSEEILRDLKSIRLEPSFESSDFTAYDIFLASHLWGLYVVPEFQFPQEWHEYLQSVKKICNFNYHQDFWK